MGPVALLLSVSMLLAFSPLMMAHATAPPNICSWFYASNPVVGEITATGYTTSTATTVTINWGEGPFLYKPTVYDPRYVCPNYGSQTHIYSIPGNYTIGITATDSLGQYTWLTGQIVVLPQQPVPVSPGGGGGVAPRII